MGSDTPLGVRIEAALRATDVPGSAATPADHIDRQQFRIDVQALELRIAIIDDRFARLAARPDDLYHEWRRDTVRRLRSVADRASVLEHAGALDASLRRRVAATLMVLKHRIAQLDARHALYPDRRGISEGPAGRSRRDVGGRPHTGLLRSGA